MSDTPEVSLQDCSDPHRVFGIHGDVIRQAAGRTVERVTIGGHPHFLKRYWWQPQCFWNRVPRRGLHELRMIQWLHKHGFLGPQVVARGRQRCGRFTSRVYFLMREVEGERRLLQACRESGAGLQRLLTDLARHLARLHDRGFVHGQLSADDLLVTRTGPHWDFRHLDLECARSDAGHTRVAWQDLADLQHSIDDESLRARLRETFILEYPAARDHVRSTEKLRRWLDRNLAPLSPSTV